MFLNTSDTNKVAARGDLFMNWGNSPVQLDLEDYYMWQFEFKASFNSRAPDLARIELHPNDIYLK